jgi:hypothetical protein
MIVRLRNDAKVVMNAHTTGEPSKAGGGTTGRGTDVWLFLGMLIEVEPTPASTESQYACTAVGKALYRLIDPRIAPYYSNANVCICEHMIDVQPSAEELEVKEEAHV